MIQSVRISRLNAELGARKALLGALIDLVNVELEGKVSSATFDRRSCSFGIGIVEVFQLNSVVVALLLASAITGNGILVELRLIENNNLGASVYALNIL